MSAKRAKIPLDAMVARKGVDINDARNSDNHVVENLQLGRSAAPEAGRAPAAKEEAARAAGRPRKRERTVTVSLRLPPETYRAFAEKAALEKVAARADGRPVESMNDMMLAALREWLDGR